MLAEQLGQEATAVNTHSDQQMAERLQAEAESGSTAQADAALARQLQAELNPGAGSGGANPTAAAGALVCRFKVTMEHVAQAGQITTVHSPEFGAFEPPKAVAPTPDTLSVFVFLCLCLVCACSTAGDVRCRLPAIIMPGLELQVTLGQTVGDEPPLAVAAPAAGAAPAITTAVPTPLE